MLLGEDNGPAEILLPQEILAQFETVNVAGEQLKTKTCSTRC
jgi:hypothetical protein